MRVCATWERIESTSTSVEYFLRGAASTWGRERAAIHEWNLRSIYLRIVWGEKRRVPNSKSKLIEFSSNSGDWKVFKLLNFKSLTFNQLKFKRDWKNFLNWFVFHSISCNPTSVWKLQFLDLFLFIFSISWHWSLSLIAQDHHLPVWCTQNCRKI